MTNSLRNLLFHLNDRDQFLADQLGEGTCVVCVCVYEWVFKYLV